MTGTPERRGEGAGRAATGTTSRLCILLAAVLLGAAVLLALAAPAHALPEYVHDGIPADGCNACHQGSEIEVTDQACITCHTGYRSMSTYSCWSCHAPGADTSGLASPSSACSQDCHLYAGSAGYTTPFTHGADPHLGASGYGKSCLDCHGTSVSATDPDGSPHHDGVAQAVPSCTDCHNGVDASKAVSHDGTTCDQCHEGMNIPAAPAVCNACHGASTFGKADCTRCHAKQIHTANPSVPSCKTCHEGYRNHAGEVGCRKCHTNAKYFHHDTQKAKSKGCASCHAKKHAGVKVSTSKCGTCHKGNAPAAKPRVQHSSKITKKYVCGACHSKPLHASAYGANVTCRSCHKSKFHGSQPTPGNSVCTNCHGSAWRHANSYSCRLCHLNAIHDATPHA